MLNVPLTLEIEEIQGSLPCGFSCRALCTALALRSANAFPLAAGFHWLAVLCRQRSYFLGSPVFISQTHGCFPLSCPGVLHCPAVCGAGMAFPVYISGVKKDLFKGFVLSVVPKGQ